MTTLPEIVRVIDVPGAPYGITVGPDGALWFTLVAQSVIGRFGDGRVQTHPLEQSDGQPTVIVADSGNALWFTEFRGGRLGRITIDGAVTSMSVDGPYGACVGPDGALWFTELQAGRVGRLAADGTITRVEVDGMPSMITPGPDGALWLTVNQGNAIARIGKDLAARVHPLPTPAAGPVGITAGPDDALWFTEIGAGAIGRIDLDGTVTEFALPDTDARPHAIVAGPDGALWFTEWASCRLGRITTDGEITHLDLPGAEPHGLTVDLVGDLWVAMESGALVQVSLS
ncbi:virginiamycin B lyase [Nocardia sp. NPDC059195]|uniref:Vgb family protein n=1 Tax=Nocardia sp. NPDC059195 TaxID=3346765 RepID=UPI00369759BC